MIEESANIETKTGDYKIKIVRTLNLKRGNKYQKDRKNTASARQNIFCNITFVRRILPLNEFKPVFVLGQTNYSAFDCTKIGF